MSEYRACRRDVEALQTVISAIRELDEPSRVAVTEAALAFCRRAAPTTKKGRPLGSKNKPAKESTPAAAPYELPLSEQ